MKTSGLTTFRYAGKLALPSGDPAEVKYQLMVGDRFAYWRIILVFCNINSVEVQQNIQYCAKALGTFRCLDSYQSCKTILEASDQFVIDSPDLKYTARTIFSDKKTKESCNRWLVWPPQSPDLNVMKFSTMPEQLKNCSQLYLREMVHLKISVSHQIL